MYATDRLISTSSKASVPWTRILLKVEAPVRSNLTDMPAGTTTSPEVAKPLATQPVRPV